jgi:hypothetical protein
LFAISISEIAVHVPLSVSVGPVVKDALVFPVPVPIRLERRDSLWRVPAARRGLWLGLGQIAILVTVSASLSFAGPPGDRGYGGWQVRGLHCGGDGSVGGEGYYPALARYVLCWRAIAGMCGLGGRSAGGTRAYRSVCLKPKLVAWFTGTVRLQV